jgi:hypothetical protein
MPSIDEADWSEMSVPNRVVPFSIKVRLNAIVINPFDSIISLRIALSGASMS